MSQEEGVAAVCALPVGPARNCYLASCAAFIGDTCVQTGVRQDRAVAAASRRRATDRGAPCAQEEEPRNGVVTVGKVFGRKEV